MALLLPEWSSPAKIDSLPDNHLGKAAVIFRGHITKGFYVNHLVFALIGAPLACSKSLVMHLDVQSLEAKLRMASKPIIAIVHEMAMVISHFHVSLSRAVE